MMDSLEIENIEKLLKELEASQDLLLIDDGISPKNIQFSQNLDRKFIKTDKSRKNSITNSYEFLTSMDLMDFTKFVRNSSFYIFFILF